MLPEHRDPCRRRASRGRGLPDRLLSHPDQAPELAGVAGHVGGRARTPQRQVDQAWVYELKAVEETQDVRTRAHARLSGDGAVVHFLSGLRHPRLAVIRGMAQHEIAAGASASRSVATSRQGSPASLMNGNTETSSRPTGWPKSIRRPMVSWARIFSGSRRSPSMIAALSLPARRALLCAIATGSTST